MSNANINNIGKRIAELRKSKGLTQDELASRLCITSQAISKWERGVGLPDVTIFPALADALGVSVALLFGEETDSNVLEVFEGCPLVATSGTLACYSNKTVSSISKEKILFADGSVADLTTKSIQHCGKGEIRIIETETAPHDIDPKKKSLEHKFDKFESLSISASFPCTAEILPAADVFYGIKATGSPLFISRIASEIVGDTLSVSVPSLSDALIRERRDTNKLTVFIPPECTKELTASIAGCALIRSTTDFENAELKISGSGNMEVQSFKELSATISGSGNIYINDVERTSQLNISGSGNIAAKSLGQSSRIKISGSGDVSAKRAKNLDATVVGSGDVGICEVSGYISCSISGSGDMTCGGSVDQLKIKITGSGDFDGQNLTANEADITVSGSGDVEIFRIITRSTERLSKSAKLRVKNRG